jgi:PleD family two-component response regulator
MLSRLSTATGQGFSAGVAGAGPDSTVEDLLRLADGGCCHAKQTGRGGVGVADGALDSVVL